MAEAFKKARDVGNTSHKEVKRGASNYGLKNDKKFDKKKAKHNGNYKNKAGKQETFTRFITKMATAPYNFVTLPDMIVPAPLNLFIDIDASTDEKTKVEVYQQAYKDYMTEQGKLSGRLELTFTTETPLFIGGKNDDDENDYFYAPNGNPVIPGSTVRGLTKNLLKIISCGAMRRDEDFNDQKLYYRDFRNENYKRYRLDSAESDYRIEPGYLIRVKGDYFVCPAQAEPIFDTTKCNKGMGIDMREDGAADIFTGYMKNKKTYMYIYNPDWNVRIRVPNEVVAEYRADKNRKGLDLFENNKIDFLKNVLGNEKDIDFAVPCFYVAKYVAKHVAGDAAKEEYYKYVAHFGHGRYYRVSYEKSIGEHVPNSLQGKVIDFAEVLFGAKKLWASRLIFEDARLISETDPIFLEKAYCHPLMTPKPTSFQFYLQPDEKGNVQNWDGNTNIRGYKLYWHQNIKEHEWKKSADDPLVDKMKKIKPLDKNNCFKGNIRFANLSEIELGALCKVFGLNNEKIVGKEIVYKLGRGKALGMGSVRIHTKLFLEKTEERYQTLFEQNDNISRWNETEESAEIKKYCGIFNEYLKTIFNKLGDEQTQKKYELGMSELRTIMDWKQTEKEGWKNKTAMMNPTRDKSDRRLRDRVVLDDALTFVKRN